MKHCDPPTRPATQRHILDDLSLQLTVLPTVYIINVKCLSSYSCKLHAVHLLLLSNRTGETNLEIRIQI